MKQNHPSLAAIFIPVFCIVVILLYFQQTAGYQDFESVKFPYIVGLSGLALFAVVLFKEIYAFVKHRTSRTKETMQTINSRRFYPLWIVVLTLGYTFALPVMHFIATTYVYVLLLKSIIGKLTLRQLARDFVIVVVLYMLAQELLLIPLPAGPLEEILTTGFRNIIGGGQCMKD